MSEQRAKYVIPLAPPWPDTVRLALDALGRAAMPAREKEAAEDKLKAAMASSIEYWGVRGRA